MQNLLGFNVDAFDPPALTVPLANPTNLSVVEELSATSATAGYVWALIGYQGKVVNYKLLNGIATNMKTTTFPSQAQGSSIASLVPAPLFDINNDIATVLTDGGYLMLALLAQGQVNRIANAGSWGLGTPVDVTVAPITDYRWMVTSGSPGRLIRVKPTATGFAPESNSINLQGTPVGVSGAGAFYYTSCVAVTTTGSQPTLSIYDGDSMVFKASSPLVGEPMSVSVTSLLGGSVWVTTRNPNALLGFYLNPLSCALTPFASYSFHASEFPSSNGLAPPPADLGVESPNEPGEVVPCPKDKNEPCTGSQSMFVHVLLTSDPTP